MANFNAIQGSYNGTNGETIIARVTNTNTQCFSITQFNIIVNPLPIIDFGEQVICPENFPLVVSADIGLNGNDYLWSTGETTPDIEIRDVGTYSVTITTSSGLYCHKRI